MNRKQIVAAGFEKALTAQQPLAVSNVERLRRLYPDDSPADLVRRLDRYFLTAVTTSGAAAGATGSVPGGGIPLALADVMIFTEAATFYVLSLAEIYGLDADDVERRKLLVMTVLLGQSAISSLESAVPKTSKYWAKLIVEKVPMKAIHKANKVLGPHFITKYGTKQGVLVLSKQAPLGIGAALGGGGNHLVGRLTIKSARKIFGPPPTSWPDGAVRFSDGYASDEGVTA